MTPADVIPVPAPTAGCPRPRPRQAPTAVRQDCALRVFDDLAGAARQRLEEVDERSEVRHQVMGHGQSL